MTLKDIAAKLGVSKTTVSVCLNGREADPRYCICPEKAERIRAYAQSCGYVCNAAASRLRSANELPPVGVIFSEHHGFERRLSAFHDVISVLTAGNRSYQVLGYRSNQISKALELLRGQRVQEVVCLSYLLEPCPIRRPREFVRRDPAHSRELDAYLEDWRRTGLLLKNMTMYSLYYQFPKPVDGGLAQGLVRMGNDIDRFVERILRKIRASGLGPVVFGRWSGVEERLIPELLESPEYIVEAPLMENRYEAGRILGRKLLNFRKKHFFRTVFYGNDMVAGGIMAVFQENGLRIPEDVAVLGFGNDDADSCLRVPLSTFESGIRANARFAARAIVEHKPVPSEHHVEFKYIERASFQFKP